MTRYRNPELVLRQRPAANLVATLIVAAATATGVPAQGDAQEADVLTIDQLLSIESVVSGSPAWSPDGSSILFQSSLSGGLVTLPPDGGFRPASAIEMGQFGSLLVVPDAGVSPKGNWISYVSTRAARRRSGSGPPATAPRCSSPSSAAARINSMAWSPDDERSIAFAGDRYGQLRHLDGRGRHSPRPAHQQRQELRGVPDLDPRTRSASSTCASTTPGRTTTSSRWLGRLRRAHRAPGPRLLRLRRRRDLRLSAGLARRHSGALPLAPQRLDQLLARPDRGR